jgi:membrane-associated phospholipid phosphatase
MKYWIGLCFTLLISSNTLAQPTSIDPTSLVWKNTRDANIISNVTVGISIGLDTWDSWKSVDRKRAFIKQGERTVIVLGATEIVKRLTHRTRPDNSDNLSFFSEHTEFASMNQRWMISIPLMTSTGYLRIAANKHYLTDVIVGGVVGSLVNRIR